MTPSDSNAGSYAPAPRQKLPGWLWGLGACACLPIVGVIVLGLIAAPVLKRIREANREGGRSRVCLTNVKQIATGLQMYAQDYDDHLPPAGAWMDASAAFVQNSGAKDKPVFRCPTIQVKNAQAFGYAYNTKVAGKPLSKIPNPMLAPTVYDSDLLGRNANDAFSSLPNPGRHHGRRFRPGSATFDIAGYADGHAKAVNESGKSVKVPGLDTGQ